MMVGFFESSPVEERADHRLAACQRPRAGVSHRHGPSRRSAGRCPAAGRRVGQHDIQEQRLMAEHFAEKPIALRAIEADHGGMAHER